MTQKFTAEEVRNVARQLDGLSRQMLNAYADALSKPADSGRVDVRSAVMDALADALGDAYDCNRVWSAWSYGSRLGELADAAIAALAAQGQSQVYRCPRCATAMQVDPTAKPASPAGVPDGMVLVPWEPTPVMLAIYEHIRSGSDWQAHVFRLTKRQLNRHRAAYKAMIAAAPSAPTENAGVPNGAVEVLRYSIGADANAVSLVFRSQEQANRFHARMDEAMKIAQNIATPSAPEGDGGGE